MQQDFECDLKQQMHTMFSFIGVKIPIKNDFHEMLIDYLTIYKKYVHEIPRQVFILPELKLKLANHPKQSIVYYIKYLLEVGRNVNLFQNKRLFQSKFHDHLLYEWKIYHFHLSHKFEKNNTFVKQTDILLFAYIDDKQAIFLDIEKHKEGIFADEKWLELLDIHYPEILEKYHAKDILDISPYLSPFERQMLWDKGYTIGMTKANGKIFHSPGIGRTTSGHSLEVTLLVDKIQRWVFEMKNQFESKRREICESFKLDSAACVFKLRFGEATLEVFEMNSKTVLLTFPEIFEFSDYKTTY